MVVYQIEEAERLSKLNVYESLFYHLHYFE
jgi:hypothetical protein